MLFMDPVIDKQSQDLSQGITQELYKRNAELAVRNKTLALLGELYGISIQTLNPTQLVEKVTSVIQKSLEFEFVGIFELDQETDILKLVRFSASDRFNSHIKNVDNFLEKTVVKGASREELFAPVVNSHVLNYTNDLNDIFRLSLSDEEVKVLQKDTNVRTTMAYPLSAGGVVAVLVISLNRAYKDLNDFEKQSIASFIDVIAVSLAKATLYKELQESNKKLAQTNSDLNLANNKLKELDRQKTEFVSIASHQLRSPLTAIKGYSSMMLEGSFGELGKKANDAVHVIFQSSQKLVMVIEDFLNVTRIELGSMKYTMETIDLADVTKKVVGELEMIIKNKGLTLDFNTDEVDSKVNADSGKIAQVIGNIIDNAAKYTPEGGIKVSVVRLGDMVRFQSEDTGIGMEAEVIPKLFQKFIRADGAGKTNIIGTGLGLYVAKQIVEAHGGKIWAESDGPGKGSRFIVELPVAA